MDKQKLNGYMEFISYLPEYELKAELSQLLESTRETQIHTFGWPIGPVISRDDFAPKAYSSGNTQGIKCTIQAPTGRYDYWSLDKTGQYYILATLFENERKPNHIFFDTRTIRTAETLLRTASLYIALGVPQEEKMECRIEYGGLMGRTLSAASPTRLMLDDKQCEVNVVQRTYFRSIEAFINSESLKEMVFDTVKGITEMCGMWVPSKEEVIDPIVENYLAGNII